MYAGFRRHVEILLREAGSAHPLIDSALRLAPLAGEFLQHLRLDLGLERDAIADRLQAMFGHLVTRRRSASGGGDLEAVDPW